MSSRSMKARTKYAGLLCSLGVLCQLGGCDIGAITTTQTLDGRSAIIQLVRGAILTPIDAWITSSITNVFDSDD